MKGKVWEYQDSKNQRSAFRGYVLEYTDSPTVYRHVCPEVRSSKLQAKKDAEKLAKKLKCQKSPTTSLSAVPSN